MSNCIIKGSCNVCSGEGARYLWNGEVDEDGNFVSPAETDCPYCEDGLVQIFTVNIPELDDIITKLNAIWDVLPEGWKT